MSQQKGVGVMDRPGAPRLAPRLAVLLLATACGPSTVERAQLAATCSSAGERAFELYKVDLEKRYGQVTAGLDKPEFHFNGPMSTCLMRVGHWSFIPFTERTPHQQDSDLLNEVIDVYSNKTIISGGHQNRYDKNGNLGTALIGTNPLDFDERAKVLMSQ